MAFDAQVDNLAVFNGALHTITTGVLAVTVALVVGSLMAWAGAVLFKALRQTFDDGASGNRDRFIAGASGSQLLDYEEYRAYLDETYGEDDSDRMAVVEELGEDGAEAWEAARDEYWDKYGENAFDQFRSDMMSGPEGDDDEGDYEDWSDERLDALRARQQAEYDERHGLSRDKY